MSEQSRQSISTPAPAAPAVAPASAMAPRDTSNAARQEALRARMASAPPPAAPARPWYTNLGGSVMDAVDGVGSAAMNLRDRALHGAVGAVTGAVGGAADRAGLPGVGNVVRGAGAAADHVVELQSGLLRAGGNMASGAARLGVDTDAQRGLAQTAYNATWLSDVGAARENDRRVVASGGGAAERASGALQTVAGRRVAFARGVGSGMVAHAAEDWRSGHRMRAAGRVVGDVGSQLFGLGEAGGAARAGGVGRAAELGAAARLERGAAAGARAGAEGGAVVHGMGAARPPMPVQQMPAVSVAQAQAGVMPRGFAAGPVSSRPVVSNPVGQMPAVSLADAQAGRLGPRNASHGPVGSAPPTPMEVHELPAVNPADIAAGRVPPAGGGPVRRRPQGAASPAPAGSPTPAVAPTPMTASTSGAAAHGVGSGPTARGAAHAPDAGTYQRAWESAGNAGPAPAGGFETPHGAVLSPDRGAEWAAANGEHLPTHAPVQPARHRWPTPQPAGPGAVVPAPRRPTAPTLGPEELPAGAIEPALEPTILAPAPAIEPLPELPAPLPAPERHRWPPPPEVGPNPVVPNLPEHTLPGQAPGTLPGRPDPSAEPTFRVDPAAEPTIRTDPALEPTLHGDPALEPTLHGDPALEPTLHGPARYPDPNAPPPGTARSRSPEDYVKHWHDTGHSGVPPKDGFDVPGGRVLPPGRPERIDDHVLRMGDAIREGRSASPLPVNVVGQLDATVPAERAILEGIARTHAGSVPGDFARKLLRHAERR